VATTKPSVREGAGPSVVLGPSQFGELVGRLSTTGRRIIAPVVRDGVVALGEISGLDDLPTGWYDDQDAGRYRARHTDDGTWFSHTTPSQPWRRFLQPERTLIVRTRQSGSAGWSIDEADPARAPLAFLGIRSCDLHALARLDTVLGERDDYATARQDLLVVAVACTTSSRACFCASMGTGPEPAPPADVVLTELPGTLLARPMTEAGHDLLAGIGGDTPTASQDQLDRARSSVEAAAQAQTRFVPKDHRSLLPPPGDESAWLLLADRCVGCANCTLVCPTCFCTSVEDRTDLTGDEAERWQRWDSCFSLDFSYVHGGGPVRSSIPSRYRQWLLHKLDTWHDQFGESGCVGCGRCIVWCPTGIDLTAAVQPTETAGATR
jgi:ferredoxin